MDRKPKRTIISIEDEYQPQLDFDDAAHALPFTFPEYQRELILPRENECCLTVKAQFSPLLTRKW